MSLHILNIMYCICKKDLELKRAGWLITHHFLDLSFGGGFLGIRKRALIGCMSHKATEIKEMEIVRYY